METEVLMMLPAGSSSIASFRYNASYQGYIGLKVTNRVGLSDIDYSAIEITNANSPPKIDAFYPENGLQKVGLNTTQIFNITSSDPNGDPINTGFYLDNKRTTSDMTNNPSTFTYNPINPKDVGVHFIYANVSDNHPLGGMVFKKWIVAAVAADEDNDGWNSNVDCNDNNINVNPDANEIRGNNIDDDRNPATLDSNSLPVANNQTLTVLHDRSSTIYLTGSDPENDPITFSILSESSHGNLTNFNQTTGIVTYTPVTNFTGTDSFTFKASDGLSESRNGTIEIQVINTVPVANNQTVEASVNKPVSISLSGYDQDNDPIVLSLLSNPSHGNLSSFVLYNGSGYVSADVTYTPVTNFTGTDSFTFKASDGLSDSELYQRNRYNKCCTTCSHRL